jgi:SNF2 family DNA or RNA helicase
MASPNLSKEQPFLLWTDRRKVAIEAHADGVLIRSLAPDIFRPYLTSDWRRLTSPMAMRNFSNDLPLLQQNQLISARGDDLFVPIPALYTIVREEIPLFLRILRACPLSLRVASVGVPGQERFAFKYAWYRGSQEVYPSALGAFVSLQDSPYLLDYAQYNAIRAINDYNALAVEERIPERGFRVIAELHKHREHSDITLDEFLEGEHVITPSKVGVRVHKDGTDSVSLYPVFEGVETDSMRTVFMSRGEVDGIYDVPRSEGGRQRVLVSEDIQEVLQDLRKARRVSGHRAKLIEQAPISVLRDGVNRDVLDGSFSPRVIGLTDMPISQISKRSSQSHEWIEREESADKNHNEAVSEGSIQDHVYGDQETLSSFKPTYRILQILTNEEEVEFAQGDRNTNLLNSAVPAPVLPRSLVSNRINHKKETVPFSLKDHQRVGVAWLQDLFRNRSSHQGCLLADDMGLGKTLQLLTFMASVVEGKLGFEWPKEPPYEPILVIAPMILFENWLGEIENSFWPSPFGDILTLHSSELVRLRRPNSGNTHELKLEESILELDRIRNHRVVLTNYETVRNYQHSLGKIQWSIVVADEAQEIKTRSITSVAVKALKSHFNIASTGTPVENRLLDLWNIVDFVQPGTLLGAAEKFRDEYETPMSSDDQEARMTASDKLREDLGYNRPGGAVLRRDKKNELKDLPAKHIRKIECDLSREEVELYSDLRQRIKDTRGRGAHLSLIANDLKYLFNHPRLYKGNYDVSNPAALLAECSKLKKLLETLEGIKKLGQKVLIFSDRRHMQAILAEVIEYALKIRPVIINSLTGTGSVGSEKSRANLIRQFEAVDGFNVIILSPQCAGVGLTITGANHVIHYGRWWNPAVENQATDRAYRIGQSLPVFVYYLIAKDPSGTIPRTFDQILDDLLASKAGIAEDFLSGASHCEINESEVFDEIMRGPAAPRSAAATFNKAQDLEALDPHIFEELCGMCLEKQGYSTIVAPKSNDGGVDVLAWNSDEIRLVQCKHSSSSGAITEDFIDDLLGGEQTFQRELQRVAKGRYKTLAVMTNGRVPFLRRGEIRRQGIKIVQGGDLLKQLQSTPISYGDLSAYRTRRCTSRKEFLERLARIVY